MEEAAGVHRHLFRCCVTALRTGEHGFKRHRLRRHYFGAPLCSVEGKPAFVEDVRKEFSGLPEDIRLGFHQIFLSNAWLTYN
jgi:hypothetical protein